MFLILKKKKKLSYSFAFPVPKIPIVSVTNGVKCARKVVIAIYNFVKLKTVTYFPHANVHTQLNERLFDQHILIIFKNS